MQSDDGMYSTLRVTTNICRKSCCDQKRVKTTFPQIDTFPILIAIHMSLRILEVVKNCGRKNTL